MGIRRFFSGAVVAALVAGGAVGQVRGEEGGARSVSAAPADRAASVAFAAEYAAKRQELQKVEKRLDEEREELAKLRHRWVVVKGRTPTQEEIAEFDEKVAQGKATPAENPYFNKSPLSTPAPARSAYYAKLDEVRRDEERVRQLKEELAALDQKGGRGGERR